MTADELNEILDLHKKWLCNNNEGKRADLRGADLRCANLRGANLQDANLRCANLRGANLQDADLQDANLRGANLQDANLQDANLQRANLQRADLRCADLRCADLQDADLDYSCWPLWCGSLGAKVCDRIVCQLLYHVLRLVKNSPAVSADIKSVLLTSPIAAIANRFHRVEECGRIEIE